MATGQVVLPSPVPIQDWAWTRTLAHRAAVPEQQLQRALAEEGMSDIPYCVLVDMRSQMFFFKLS